MAGPLTGVRVLDLTRLLPGGYATMLLADLGADVVKVERPGEGDGLRTIPPVVEGDGAVHRALNRGKRSVALDLKRPGGAAALRRLAAGADVLVESFRPGVMERLGLGYEALTERAPRLLYVSITGYGRSGPDRDRAGHDINYVGQAGILAAAADAHALPGVQIADLAGGMAAAVTLLAHLPLTARTGRGRLLDVSLLDAAVSWMWSLPAHLAGRPAPARELTGGLACYRVYAAADGRLLTVGALEPRFWANLCEALEAPDLADGQYGPPERQEEIAARLAGIFAGRPRNQWLDALDGLDVCVGPVHDLPGVLADPQIVHRGMIAAEAGGEPVGPSSPIGPGGRATRPAPSLGQHTEEVLAEAGLTPGEIADLG